MRIFILAFASGVWLLQQQAVLPSAWWLARSDAGALLVLALQKSALAIRRLFCVSMIVASVAALGFIWAAGFAHLRLAEELAAGIERRDVEVSGVVSS